MRRRELLTAGGLLALGAAGCRAPDRRSAATSRLTVATASEIARLSVGGGGGAGGSEILNVMLLLFDTLVSLDERLEVVPRLATSWRRSSERGWVFTLAPNVRFSNGERCDAAAVAHSIVRLTAMVPGYRFRAQWGEAWPPTARAIDPSNVEISTPVAQVTLPHLLSRIEIVPPVASESGDFANLPVGSGPYRLKSWTRGGTLTLEANQGYFLGRPRIDELVWISIKNPAARVAALRAGDVDLAWDIPYERIKLVEDDPRLKVLNYQSIGLAFIAFNFRATSSPITNPAVRRALTFAIDAEDIHRSLLGGQGELSRGPAPSRVVGAVDAGGYPNRDVIRAKRMLAEAGHPDGLDLVLVYEPGNFAHDEDVCGAVVAQLAEANVRVRFDEVPPGAMRQRMMKEDWDLAPNSVPGSFTGQASYHYFQLKATLGYRSDPIERLLRRSDAIDTPERLALIEAAMRLLWADTPYLWSMGVARTFGTVKDLTGVSYVPINWLKLDRASL